MRIIPVKIDVEIDSTSSLSDLLLQSISLCDGDIIVVAQKIVSKNENRVVRLDDVVPSLLAQGIAAQYEKDPRVVELILNETKRIVRMGHRVIITQTNHGFVCANAGVDQSNLELGYAALLPIDSDVSAARLREEIADKSHKQIGVIISDTFGRPFRLGQTNCAIGVSGLDPILDYRGTRDSFERTLQVTEIAVADEISSAAELVMKKISGCPFVIVRGYTHKSQLVHTSSLIRHTSDDLFI